MYGRVLNVESWWERAVKHNTLSVLWDICRRLLSLRGRMYDVYNLVPPLTPSVVTGFVVKGLQRLLPVSACDMSSKSDVEVALNSDMNCIPKKADLYLNHIWKCFKRIRFTVVKKKQNWATWGGPNQIQATWACSVKPPINALFTVGGAKGENTTNKSEIKFDLISKGSRNAPLCFWLTRIPIPPVRKCLKKKLHFCCECLMYS